MLMLLLQTPTNQGCKIAITFLQECGQFLLQYAPSGLKLVTDYLNKSILKANNLNHPLSRLNFIGFEGTYYGNQEIDNHNGIIARLHRNEINQ